MADVIRRIKELAPSLNDADLVLAARTGEAWARKALFHRHVDRLHGLSFRLLGPYSGTREILVRAFAESFAALAQLRNPPAFLPWVHRNTVRAVRARLRQSLWAWQRKRPRPDFIGFRSQLVLTGDNDDRAEILAFYESLEKLPLEPRLAALLRDLELMTPQEIACAMQASPLRVRRWLLHADRALKPGSAPSSRPFRLQRDSQELPIPLSEFEREQIYRKIETALGEQGWQRWVSVAGWACAALVLLVLGSVGLSLLSRRTEPHQEEGSLLAASAPRQSVELPDGSRAVLSAATQLRIDSAEPRHIRLTLVAGHADFEIADTARGSFIVNAGDTTVRALGRLLAVSVDSIADSSNEVSVEVHTTEGPADVQRGSGRAPLVLGAEESWTGRVPRVIEAPRVPLR